MTDKPQKDKDEIQKLAKDCEKFLGKLSASDMEQIMGDATALQTIKGIKEMQGFVKNAAEASGGNGEESFSSDGKTPTRNMSIGKFSSSGFNPCFD